MRGHGGPSCALRLLWALALLGAPAAWALRCERTPEGRMGGRARIDGRYFLKISGNADSYVPNTVYTVSLQGQRNSQLPNKFTGFLLVAETESRDPVSDSFVANQKSNDVGTFQTLGDSLTKYSEKCPNAVAHASSLPKSEIQALWTAPPAGSGCVTIKATVIEHHDIWYMDEGPLSKTLCENVQESFDMQPPIVNKCCACDEAKYEVTFEGLWSRHTHPKDFPVNGWLTRFSDVIGASHAADYRFWDYGRHASEGLKQLAEHGATRVLESELKAESNHIRTIIKARGISYPNLTGKTFAVFRVDNRHHLMSLVSMIDPSPDWIVGVSGLELCQPNCSWVESKVLNLYPWDAGTDSGPTYISSDQPTTPRDVIRRIRPTFPNDPRSPFYDPSGAEMKPLARLYLSRQRLYEKSCDSNGITGTDEDLDPDPCAVTAWSDWSPCSKTCGDGTRRRQRWFISQARADVAGCNKRLTSRENCKGPRPHCRQGSKAKKNRIKENRGKNQDERKSEDETPAEDEESCQVTPWLEWMDCSATCGKGWRMRTRKLVASGEEQQDQAYMKIHQKRALWGADDPPKDEDGEEEDGEGEGEEEEEEEAEESQNEEDQPEGDGKCAHIKLVERVECEGALPTCDITEEEARRRGQFAGLDTGNQMGHRIAGEVSSVEVTGDGSLSGYDGPTYSPNVGSNNIEQDPVINGRYRNNYNRHKGNNRDRNNQGNERDRNIQSNERNRNNQGNQRDRNNDDSERDRDNQDNDRGRQNKNRFSSRGSQYQDSKEPDESNHRSSDRGRHYSRGSKEDGYAAASKFSLMQGTFPGTGGVIEEPVGQIKKCKVSPWSAWNGCNATCGRGFEQKSRYIIQNPVNGGRNCPKKLLKRRKCKHLRPCKNNDHLNSADGDNNYDSTNPTWGPGNPIANARRDCILLDWSPWSPCSESCGEGAVRQRTRAVHRHPSNGGAPCAPRLDKQSCDLMPCRL